MKRWKGNGKPPSISLANQPRTCLQAEYTINQSTAALSLFFHSILLSSLILDSLDGVKFWCGWRAAISVFHFYSSTFQISPFCLQHQCVYSTYTVCLPQMRLSVWTFTRALHYIFPPFLQYVLRLNQFCLIVHAHFDVVEEFLKSIKWYNLHFTCREKQLDEKRNTFRIMHNRQRFGVPLSTDTK